MLQKFPEKSGLFGIPISSSQIGIGKKLGSKKMNSQLAPRLVNTTAYVINVSATAALWVSEGKIRGKNVDVSQELRVISYAQAKSMLIWV